jgi:DNA-binding beta-propeller fold protein YncE
MQGVVGWMAVDRGRFGTLSLVVLAITLLLCQTAGAALPDEDPWEGHRCATGSGAGECSIPRGIAADPRNGHIFVADQNNNRVNEFNALGQFIKAWGWDVVLGGGTEFEICKVGDTCKPGTEGSGVGQLSAPQGVALDSSGNIYVVDVSNNRVQKFDPAGKPLLAFGSPGSGPGQFSGWGLGSYVAVDPADNVYVGDVERIQRFNTAGAYQDECAVTSGETVQSLAVDSTGNLYAVLEGGVRKLAYVGGGACDELDRFDMPPLPEGVNSPIAVTVDTEGNVFTFGCCGGRAAPNPIIEFDSKGKVIAEFGKGEYNTSTGLAINLCAGSDPPGNLYVSNSTESNSFIRAYGTDPVGCFKARTEPPTNVEETSATLNGSVNPNGEVVSECFFEFGLTTGYGQKLECTPKASELGTGSTPVPVHFDIAPLQKATAYHYRLVAKVGAETEFGSDVEFKTKGPPVIADEHVVSVIQSEATLKALVNPEGLATSCHFDYGTGETPSQSLGDDRKVHIVTVNLKGLAPGTTYHWRIVCANSSGSSESEDHTLFAYPPFASESGCPNQVFRTEASALLSDCRAYELVSPVDKNGGDIVRGSFTPGDPDGYTQATPEGNRITYTALSPFGELPSGVNFNQYLSERSEGGRAREGWSSQGIRPPVEGHNVIKASVGFNVQRQYMAFTPDLCYGWLIDQQTPPLTPEAIDGFPNLFRRDNCEPGKGDLEALTDVAPPDGTDPAYVTKRSVQGASADGSHALFVALAKLTSEAPEDGSYKLYDRFGGAIHLVSIVPDKGLGDPTPGDGKGAPVGGKLGAGKDWQGNLATAVSRDGSRIYWSNGELYLRIHPEQGLVEGECTTPAKACTVRAGGGEFWAASADGSKAIFTESEKLFEFDLGRREKGEKASREIAKGVKGVAGASEDLSHVYFVSRDALDGGAAGKPNLYLAEGGAVSFIATLSEKDMGEKKEPGADASPYTVVAANPYDRPTRVSADGEAIAFDSRASLTGYDNTDTASGKAAVEVFVYQAGSDELQCASCNPSEARPQTLPEMHQPYTFPWDPGRLTTKVPAAALLPTWEQPTYASRPLSANGSRLFFNSYDTLLPRDTNGKMDVYEWEAAGTGSCKATKGNPSYFAQRGGCIYLISSGESSYESEFWEASANGSDVFFTTESSFVPPDPGSIDLYDARVDGGFKYPVPKPPCEGEACQSPPPAPDHPTPASSASPGNGNVDNKEGGGGGPNCGALSRKAKHLSAAARRAGGSTPKGQRLSHKARQAASQANHCRARQRRAK